MKNQVSRFNQKFFLGLTLLVILIGITVTTSVQAASKPTVVLFYADWNVRCREAKPVVESVVATYGNRVSLQELNIDLNTTPDRARAMGLSSPRTIPMLYVLDRNDNVVFSTVPTGNAQQLKSQLDSVILPLIR